MPKQTTSDARLRRAPNGLRSGKPVAVRFTLEELTWAENIAGAEKRTLASTTRLLALRGMAEYARDRRSLTEPVEIPSA